MPGMAINGLDVSVSMTPVPDVELDVYHGYEWSEVCLHNWHQIVVVKFHVWHGYSVCTHEIATSKPGAAWLSLAFAVFTMRPAKVVAALSAHH